MQRSKNDLLETERLLLQPTSEADAAFILELLNTPKWLEYIGDRNVHTISDASNYIRERILPQYFKLGFGNYTVIRKSDHMKMGSCGLYDRPGLEGFDLGFAFLPAYEKQGYAFESTSFLLEHAADHFGLDEFKAITTEKNESSKALLEKLGFRFSKYITLEGDDEMLLLYELNNTR